MSIIKKDKDNRKQIIIITAAQLFLKNGIDNIKMTDIAESCDIGVATLYRYFGTKTSIVIACGTLLWKDVGKLFDDVFECEYFENKSGIEQIKDLLKIFLVIFHNQKSFLKFIYDFDNYILSNNVPDAELKEYENSILNYYPLFEKSYKKGCEDNSVKKDIDIELFYKSITHSILAVSQKFICGEILASDDFSKAGKELNLYIEIAIDYIKNTDYMEV